MIVQDDTLVASNFSTGLDRIVSLFPDHVVCLYYPGYAMKSDRNLRNALQRKQSFFLLNRMDFLPVVGVLWPREKAEHFFTWAPGRTFSGLKKPYRSDDAIAGLWMRFTKQDVYATFPSLVQHPDDVAPVKDGPHEAKHGRDKGRVARSFISDASSFLEQ